MSIFIDTIENVQYLGKFKVGSSEITDSQHLSHLYTEVCESGKIFWFLVSNLLGYSPPPHVIKCMSNFQIISIWDERIGRERMPWQSECIREWLTYYITLYMCCWSSWKINVNVKPRIVDDWSNGVVLTCSTVWICHLRTREYFATLCQY